MKANGVSVSVVNFGGELHVNVAFRIPGSLQREDPPNDFRVREGSRKRKQKEIQHWIESLDISAIVNGDKS